MKLFKQKISNANATAFENVQADIKQKNVSSVLTRGEQQFEVEIEANMAELINNKINGIEIVTKPKESIIQNPETIKDFNKSLKGYKRSMSAPQSVLTVDPKELLPHGDLGDLGSSMISPAGENQIVKDNVLESHMTFLERPISSLRPAGNVNVNDIVDNLINFDRGTEPLANTKSLASPVMSPFKNLNLNKPTIKSETESFVPKVTKKKITVTAPLGFVPEVRLKNPSGRSLGSVKKNAKLVKTTAGRSSFIKNYNYFSTLAKERKIFTISFSHKDNIDYLHINSTHNGMIDSYRVLARSLSRTPEIDSNYDLGVFSKGQSKAINLTNAPFDFSKKIMFHIIPIVNGIEICHSQTAVNEGFFDEYNTTACGMQFNSEAVRFYIANIPCDATQIFAVRTNTLSGQTQRLSNLNIDMSGGVRKTSENKTNDIVLTYDDSRISDINTVYAYDFFAVNRYGIEKHLFQKTVRTYEKDLNGHVFKSAKMSQNRNGTPKFKVSLTYPNPFIPKDINYSLNNPSDDFYEACRNNKRVCTLKIIRHSSTGVSENLGIYVLNPGELNTLEANIDKYGNFEAEFEIDTAFLQNAGVTSYTNSTRNYYYEFRMGSYLLANELSFLEEPLKLEVPNEFTDGKTGYSFHPYVYNSPSRKDYGLLGNITSSRNFLYEESLNSKTKVFVQDAEPKYKGNKSGKFRARLEKVGTNDHCVVLQMRIDESLIRLADHFELLVGDSTTGEFRSLGKNKLVNSQFYYIDASSADLACNKLKYKLIARSLGFENIASFETDLIDIASTNVLRKRDERATLGAIGLNRQDKFRGIIR